VERSHAPLTKAVSNAFCKKLPGLRPRNGVLPLTYICRIRRVLAVTGRIHSPVLAAFSHVWRIL
jgi:hypothetical protein